MPNHGGDKLFAHTNSHRIEMYSDDITTDTQRYREFKNAVSQCPYGKEKNYVNADKF